VRPPGSRIPRSPRPMHSDGGTDARDMARGARTVHPRRRTARTHPLASRYGGRGRFGP